MLLLVGGLGVGVVLVEQPQLLGQKAATVEYCTQNSGTGVCQPDGSVKVCVGGTVHSSTCPNGCSNGICRPPLPTPINCGSMPCQYQTTTTQKCVGYRQKCTSKIIKKTCNNPSCNKTEYINNDCKDTSFSIGCMDKIMCNTTNQKCPTGYLCLSVNANTGEKGCIRQDPF